MTSAQPERQWEEEAWVEVEIPPPSLPRRLLSAEHVEAKSFPCRPARAAWRKALAAGHQAHLTYSIGPWMNARLEKILEEDCHTVALWVLKSDGSKLRATWICRGGKWSFESAFRYAPPALMNATEMKTWLS